MNFRDAITSLLAVCLSLSVISGCTLDFDQFPAASDGGNTDNNGSSNNGQLSDMDEDASEDLGDMPDMAAPGGPLGTTCASDTDCQPGLTCRDTQCSMDCSVEECPEGSACIEWSGELFCALGCDACPAGTACSHETNSVGERVQVCLVDGDADGTSDISDNCATDANASQVDTDGDGLGDSCDTNRVCLAGAEQGQWDIGSLEFGVSNPSLPDYSTGPKVLVAGGTLPDGSLSNQLGMIDLSTGTFSATGELPYPSANMAIAESRGGHTLSPGDALPAGPQNGRLIDVRVAGAEVGESFYRTYHQPTFMRTSDGRLWLHAFTSESAQSWQVMYYDPINQRFNNVLSSGGTRGQWYAAVSADGRGYFYSQSRNTARIGWLVTVSPGTTSVRNTSIDWPDVTEPFDPFITPGVGNTLWVWERTTGQAWVFDQDSQQLTRVTEFDLPFVQPVNRFVSMVGGPGFLHLAAPDLAATAYEATFYSLPCRQNAPSVNRDGDSIPDVVDNCPTVANEGQEALDDDLLGNECDPDDDGDGIGDLSDVIIEMGVVVSDLSLDSDNDGTPNSTDSDADGDGIEDAMDRYLVDTTNNGAPNEFDVDDDGDGYTDSTEIGYGSDSIDPVEVPFDGFVAYVRDDAGTRTVEWGAFNSIRDTPQVAFSGSDPYLPRLTSGGQAILALEGAPEVTSDIRWFDTVSQVETAYTAAGVLRGVDPESISAGLLQSYVATIQRADGGWEIQSIPTDIVTPPSVLYDVLPNIGAPDWNGSIVFSAAHNGCVDCNDPWTLSGTVAYRITTEIFNPTQVRLVGYYSMLGAGTDVPRAGFISYAGYQELVPPGATTVESIVPVHNNGSALVSAEVDGVHQIWFYNQRVQRWHRFVSGPANLVEVDWSP